MLGRAVCAKEHQQVRSSRRPDWDVLFSNGAISGFILLPSRTAERWVDRRTEVAVTRVLDYEFASGVAWRL